MTGRELLIGVCDSEPVFVVVSADRDAVLALAFPSITKLPDCSPANLTIGNGSFTATYQRTSAFTEADQSYAVIATIFVEGQCPTHFLRVAAKNGILFVQATMPLADPADYPDEANRPGSRKLLTPTTAGASRRRPSPTASSRSKCRRASASWA